MKGADSGEEVGVQSYSGYLMELMRGMSEENQATFKRKMGSHGVDDVSSLEGDKPQVGVHGQDVTETPPGEDDEQEDSVMKRVRDDVDRGLDDGWSRGSRTHGAGVLDARVSASMITNRNSD